MEVVLDLVRSRNLGGIALIVGVIEVVVELVAVVVVVDEVVWLY